MNIVKAYPPNIDKIRERFKLHKGIVFTYGNTLYNPDDGHIDESLIVHEETHVKQQGDDVEGWWKKYLSDDAFRLSQEIEAYRNQYADMKKRIKDRNQLNFRLRLIANDLSSEMYGNIMTFDEARKSIVAFVH